MSDNGAPQCFQGFECYFYPGWDGFNANPIDRTGFEIAQKVIKNLPSKFQNPDVAPAVDGSICMEWMFAIEEEIYLDVSPCKLISIFYNFHGNHSVKTFDHYSSEVDDYIKQLFNGLK